MLGSESGQVSDYERKKKQVKDKEKGEKEKARGKISKNDK